MENFTVISAFLDCVTVNNDLLPMLFYRSFSFVQVCLDRPGGQPTPGGKKPLFSAENQQQYDHDRDQPADPDSGAYTA